MKKSIVAITVLSVAVLLGAPVAQGTSKELTPEERAARKEAMLRNTGGLLRSTNQQKGKVAFINAQKTVERKYFDEVVQLLERAFSITFEVIDADVASPRQAKEALKKSGANVAVVMGSCADTPTLVVAPDEDWAFVNVAALAGGDVNSRAQKMLIRAFAFVGGGVSSSRPDTLVAHMDGMERLDATPVTALSGDVSMRMSSYLKGIGVTPSRLTTYKRACIEGWAPAPTNDYQKAIFEQVKLERERGPANPIKITPPRK